MRSLPPLSTAPGFIVLALGSAVPPRTNPAGAEPERAASRPPACPLRRDGHGRP